MKTQTREVVRIALVALLVMMALPAAYRLWVHFHPQPVEPRPTMLEFFARTAEGRAVRLLKKPLSAWTDGDRNSEPQVCAWLESHAKTVLPWEWTDEARRKDPNGYRKLWRGLFEELRETLDLRLEAERKALKSLERELWIAEKLHGTNRVVRAVAFAVTNAFSLALDPGELSDEVKTAGGRVSAIGGHLARIESVLGAEEVDETCFLAELCRILRSKETVIDDVAVRLH